MLSSIPNNIKIDNKLIIAYEPIWAIGTNKTTTTKEIKKMHEVGWSWSLDVAEKEK